MSFNINLNRLNEHKLLATSHQTQTARPASLCRSPFDILYAHQQQERILI